MAANQIRGGSATCDLARFRSQRLVFMAFDPGPESLRGCPGYKYVTPLGFQFAASSFAQKLRRTGRRQLGILSGALKSRMTPVSEFNARFFARIPNPNSI
jgi:hypothetical protein